MHACDLTRTALVTNADRTLDSTAYENYQRLVTRRQAGEPIAYITGTREFWSLSLMVSPSALIPRPETELLVERALTHIPRDRDCRVVDLGTGTGAIAIAIASERPQAQILATDFSIDAVALARQNAKKLGYTQVEFRTGDWLAALADNQFEVIVSNPPYIAAGDPHLVQGDLRSEPRSALESGSDGLDAIRVIANGAHRLLTPEGWLLLEHGYDQADDVAKILRAAGFAQPTCYVDLSGQPRVTEARRTVIT